MNSYNYTRGVLGGSLVSIWACCGVWVTGTVQSAPKCRACSQPMRRVK